MSNNTDVVLSTIDSSHPDERLLVVLTEDSDGSTLQLRQQTWAVGIGWYTQNTIELSPRQISQLRGVLGTQPVKSVRDFAAFPGDADEAAIIPIASFVRAHSA